MADKTRGEAVLTIGGREVKMVPTYAALADMEDRLDCGSIELLIAMAEKRVRTRQLAVVVSALSGLKEDEAGTLVVEEGIASITALLTPFLIEVFGGGGSKNGAAGRK